MFQQASGGRFRPSLHNSHPIKDQSSTGTAMKSLRTSFGDDPTHPATQEKKPLVLWLTAPYSALNLLLRN